MAPMPGMAAFFGVMDSVPVPQSGDRPTTCPRPCFAQMRMLTRAAVMRTISESHVICTWTISGRDMELLPQRSQGRVRGVDTGHDLGPAEPARFADKIAATTRP